VVDKDEVGLGTIGCAVDENAEVDGVPVVCGCLEGIHGVVEVGVARKALTDAKVPTFTTLAYSCGTSNGIECLLTTVWLG
jgi:hypothetical protein